ncbi:hypothetical protein [Polynucleobacter necessarius]|uniref:hypothetical protein n=1 Tax=Polynucleobacter necessarius TaxID=576610 RepID=UPI000E0960FA|nr:hypothetical protein [Polynucleobacter necessarius]
MGVTLSGTVSTNSAAVTLGATAKTLTLANDAVINTYADAGLGGAITISGPIQATSAGSQSLSLASKGGAVTLSGVIGSTAKLNVLTLGDANQTGTITVHGTIVANTLTTGASTGSNAFDVTLSNLATVAGTTTISNAATFYNTGTIRFGDYYSDAFNFLGGVSADASSAITVNAAEMNTTASAISLNSPTTFENSITLSPGVGQITLGQATVNPGATLTLGAGEATPVTLSSIAGTSGVKSNITINTTDAVMVSGTIGTNIGTFTVANTGSIAFNGSVSGTSDRITSLIISAGTGVIEFANNLYAAAMSNAGGSAEIKFYGSTTDITSAVTLNTTGAVYYGDATTDTPTFTRGITHDTGNTSCWVRLLLLIHLPAQRALLARSTWAVQLPS